VECLDKSALGRLALDVLPEKEAARARDHVAGCEACRAKLDAARAGRAAGSEWDDGPTGKIDAPAHLMPSGESLPRGTSLGRYLILERLGAGGMGEVYAAFDPQLNRKVALKLLLTSRGAVAQDEARVRLLREAQAMARLSHPNVVPVYDLGEFGDRVFVAMELVEGRTLRKWLEEAPRDWRTVVQALSGAGRGLAAAHAAGLVHRDFKPDNVLIGRDGRVVVLDFGLAVGRGIEGSRAPAIRPEAASAEDSGPAVLDTPVTRQGAVLGTPGYMAPEQYRGEEAGPATDQFGFCATLFHALYGTRAFAGSSTPALFFAASEGRVRPPPPEAKVPGWVHAAVLRGLSPRPEDRHPSMEALLEALRRDPAARRRRLFVAAAVGVLVLAGVGGAARLTHSRATRCQGAEARLAGVWDAGRRQAVARAFEATGAPYAAKAWQSVQQVLDGYAAGLVAQQTEACETTRVRGEASERVLALRTECLEQRRGDLLALTDVFLTADAQLVEQAVQAARTLPELAECANVDLLGARVPLPADETQATQVARLRDALAQARALWSAGRYKAGLEVVRPLVARAEAVGYLPVRAEVLLQQGLLEEGFGNAAAGERLLNRAAWTAEEAHDDRVRAEALVGLTHLLGYNVARAAEAHDVFEHGRALLARLHTGGRLRSELYSAHGLAFASEGRAPEAEAAQREALAAAERATGPDSPEVAVVLRRLANTLTAQGRHVEALPVYERALTIFRTALGAEHPRVGSTLVNLGTTYSELSRHDEALPLLHKGLGILAAALAPNHPFMPRAHGALGTALWKAGRHAKALEHLRRALAVSEAARGAEHPDVAAPCTALGKVLVDAGRAQEALGYFTRALAIQERTLKRDHPGLASALTGLGEAELALGRPKEALGALERALTIREAARVSPVELGTTRLALARALWAAGAPGQPRARALALQAEASLAGRADGAALRAQATAWLAVHPEPSTAAR
jgi:tetratricopeptide (TPR) repeat protein/predicted Ser/Thr protein kinase